MSLKSKITDVIDNEIKLFGNYQSIITKTAASNNSGVPYGSITAYDPKTGLAEFTDNQGSVYAGIQMTGSLGGPGVKGYLVGNSFKNG
jgi:hypothetical protein